MTPQDHTATKTLYLVRHGQSTHNVAPVFQSEAPPLSDIGLQQAGLIAERASHLSFETLLASPLPRARQTAEAIARTTGKQPEFMDLLAEVRKPTSIAGKPHTDEQAGKIWIAWRKSLFEGGPRIEDGENFDDIVGRARQVLANLESRPEESMVVVTHGFFLRTLIAVVAVGDALTQEAYSNFRKVMIVENTSLTVLRHVSAFDEAASWRLAAYNDQAHLAD